MKKNLVRSFLIFIIIIEVVIAPQSLRANYYIRTTLSHDIAQGSPLYPAKLLLSHIECSDASKVEVDFAVNHLLSGVSNYGTVHYVLNSVTYDANFEKRTGDTAHYFDYLTGIAGKYSVTSAYVEIDGNRIELYNPQEVNCSVPVLTPTPKLTYTPTPTATPTPMPTLKPTPTSTPMPNCVLNISKKVDKISANIGEILTYTLTFYNIGNTDCTGQGVKVKDIVDNNLTFVSETHSANVVPGYNGDDLYNSFTRALLWNAGTLSPEETGWVSWKAIANIPEGCGDFNILNTGRITSFEYSNFSNWVNSNEVKTTFTQTCPIPIPIPTPTPTLFPTPTLTLTPTPTPTLAPTPASSPTPLPTLSPTPLPPITFIGGGCSGNSCGVSIVISGPRISITKISNPAYLPIPGGLTTYDYQVYNPGSGYVTSVVLTDDKCSPVNYLGGDSNSDARLDRGGNLEI